MPYRANPNPLDLEIAKLLRKRAADFEARDVMPNDTCPVNFAAHEIVGGKGSPRIRIAIRIVASTEPPYVVQKNEDGEEVLWAVTRAAALEAVRTRNMDARMRNYELESTLNNLFPGPWNAAEPWVVWEACPFNGSHCLWGFATGLSKRRAPKE